jgi:hypothetical protein
MNPGPEDIILGFLVIRNPLLSSFGVMLFCDFSNRKILYLSFFDHNSVYEQFNKFVSPPAGAEPPRGDPPRPAGGKRFFKK